MTDNPPRSASVSVEAEWGYREESAESCATRLVRMLERLEPLHSVFRSMMWVGGPMRPLYPVPSRPEEFASLFKSSRFYDEETKRRRPCGFSLHADALLDNGRLLNLRIGAGRFVPGTPVYGFPNSVSLWTMVKDVEGSDGAYIDAVKSILLVLIETWEPGHAGVSASDFAPPSPMKAEPGVFSNGCAMLYLSPELAAAITPPPSAIIESVGNGGLLMMATDRLYQDRGPSVRVAADAIRSAVAPIGL